MYEQQLLQKREYKSIKVYRRKAYSQHDIDHKLFVEYDLIDVLEYNGQRRDTIHSYIRDYLDKYGNPSKVYMILTKFGNFKYLYSNRPKPGSFVRTYLDGEMDVFYVGDKPNLDTRWRVFEQYFE
jgi:hypothetical protein